MYVRFMDAALDVGMDGKHPPAAAAAWGAVAEASGKVAAVAGQVWELSDADLVAVLHAETVAAAQRDAARLAVIRELDARGVATRWGAVSTASWLSRELLVDTRVAAADVRAARQLDPDGDLPPQPGVLAPGPLPGHVAVAATGRALLAGEVSRSHADVVAAMVRALPVPSGPLTPSAAADRADLRPRAQQWLLEQCATFAPSDVRRLGVALRHVVDPDGVLADEREAKDRASFWVRADGDGITYRFGGTTDPVTAATLATFIDAHSAPRPYVDETTGARAADPRTAETRRGHAFIDLVNLAVNADPAVSGGIGVQLVVTITMDTLQAQLGGRGVRCATTETGHPLSAATTRRLACDATVIPMVLGAASELLDVGRATRTIPIGIRRALNERDGGCAFPGCTRPRRWADAHHIHHWADGGPTTLTNLVLLCGHHHDLIHHTRWAVRITAGRPVFTPPPDTRRSPQAHGRPPSPDSGRPPPRAPV